MSEIITTGGGELTPERDSNLSRMTERAQMLQAIASRFQDGIHYHTIRGRKTLSKAGAEEYCSWIGVVGILLHDEEIARVSGSPEGEYFFKCELYPLKDRIFLIGNGRGASTVKECSGVRNKAIKMAQKRAYVDAVLRLGGLSAVGFTQDLEDDEPPATVAAGPAPTETKAAPTAPAPSPDPDPWKADREARQKGREMMASPATQGQWKVFEIQARKAGLEGEAKHAWVMRSLGLDPKESEWENVKKGVTYSGMQMLLDLVRKYGSAKNSF